MKTAKIVFSLLLLSVVFGLPGKVDAQSPATDTIYASPNPGAPDTWQFSFNHSDTTSPAHFISNIVLTLDTTAYGSPNVRFAGNAIQQTKSLLDPLFWNAGSGPNNDFVFWCADLQTNFINVHQKDSFFIFSLQPDTIGTNIDFYPILIRWTSNYATGNECSNVQNISSGSFYVVDRPWQYFSDFDTVTATSSTPNCDPIFNLCVHDKNSLGLAIDGLIFQAGDPSAGSIRASDIQLPSGWVLDSVTEQNVYCHAQGGSEISSGQTLCGFDIGLTANHNVSEYAFAWEALSGGTVIDADTLFNIPATVPVCSNTPSLDSLQIVNNLKCNFTLNFQNLHTGQTDTISPLTKWIISTPTPGVTIQSLTRPPVSVFWQTNQWQYTPVGTNSDTLFTTQEKYGQEGAQPMPWQVTFNNSTDVPFVINWQSLNFGNVISTGTDTIRCKIPPSPDTAWFVGTNGCEYEVVVKNINNSQSDINGVSFGMPLANGTILSTPISGPSGWTASVGNNTALFTKGTGSALKSGFMDTFYFATSPKTPATPWPVHFVTSVNTTSEITDETLVAPAPGCTPAKICDTVTGVSTPANCENIINVQSRSTTAGIDSFTVTPQGGWHILQPANVIGWTTTWDPTGASATYVGGISATGNQSFAVYGWYGPSTDPFSLQVVTYEHGANNEGCTSIVPMTCANAAVSPQPSAQAQDLALTVSPNPLNSRSDIGFTLSEFSGVNLMLVDIMGRTQATLFGGSLQAGDHILPLDASSLAPGTYYLRLEAEGQRITKKIVVEH